MARDESQVRPETHALDALIRETLARGRSRGHHHSDALLFLGNRHHAFPVVVVQDPVLEPVDKLVWMVICQSAQGTGVKGLFPSYADIARLANVSSTSTVSRAIAILRATRWLSLCARNRDASGRFGGNVYALHDEPLPLADALHLDPGYMTFLHEAGNHHHARVRRVAAAVLKSLDDEIGAGKDVLAPMNATERRLDAMHVIRRGGGRPYFSFSAKAIANLSNMGAAQGRGDHDQNSKAARKDRKNSKSVPRSSSNSKKTTTTVSTDDSQEAASLGTLIVPGRLKQNHHALAARYLATIPMEQRQAVLDELAGRFEAERHGAKRVYDELRYLQHLCAQVNRGGFVPNLGLKIRAERDRVERKGARLREEAAARVLERERKDDSTRPSRETIAEIRKRLGMSESLKRNAR
jgi:hypothetical protein